MRPRVSAWNPRTIWLALAFAAVGCSQRPSAPPLANDAVYQNDKAGIRFLAPANWAITSRTDLPRGELTRPILLVAYHQVAGEKPAEFDLFVMDLPDDADLGAYLAEHRVGPEKWTVNPQTVPVPVGGLAGTRYDMTAGRGKDELQREAVAVRRGRRVYFFITTFSPHDDDHREQTHRSIESVAWTNDG